MPNIEEENYLDKLLSEASVDDSSNSDSGVADNEASDMASVIDYLTDGVELEPVSNLLSDEAGLDENVTEQLFNGDVSASVSDKDEEGDIALDLNEPILSEDDMARLASMDLDNIISDAKDETVSVEDLFNEQLSDSKDEEDNSFDMYGQSKTEVDIKLDGVSEAVDGIEENNVQSTDSNNEVNTNTESVVPELQMLNEDGTVKEEEETQEGKTHRKKKVKSKKNILKVIKSVFFEDVEETPISKEAIEAEAAKHENISPKIDKVEGRELDENEKLINDMYGDNDKLDENIAPRKGIFAKLKYRLQQLKEKNAKEDILEQEAEEKEYEEKQKQKAQKKSAAEEKKIADKEKKEADKKKKADEKAKKEAAKPKKEKKPKPQPKPEDILKIKPKSMLLFILFVAGSILLIVMLNRTISYSGAISRAKVYMGNNNYSAAYSELAGMDLNEDDQRLFEQISVVMYIERHYESYENYSSMRMHTEAINSLIKGIDRYDHFYAMGAELGMAEQMNKSKTKILDVLSSDYGISEIDANKLVDMMNSNFVTYYKTIETYGKVAK